MGDNYTIDEALPFGEMPDEAIIAKFEETDIGESEYLLEDSQWETLADFRPDPRSFEYEQPQTNNQSVGLLNHRYTGTRSGQDVHHPELFLGFHGEEDRDPRRTFTDPDFKELKKQQDMRMKYVRWNSDADNSITGGGWREDQVQGAKQAVLKSAKQRIKVFTTSKDGKRNGMNRTWEHRSIAEKVDGSNPDMTDYIRDASIVPQRKTIILSNHELSNGKFYNMNQPDHEFEVARYGDNPRSAVLTAEQGGKTQLYDGERAGSESMLTRNYKTAGILMSKIVEQKHKAAQETEYSESTQTRAYKQGVMTSDLSKLMQDVGADAHDTDYKDSDRTMTVKTKHGGNQHASTKGIANHATPDHLYLNAELMYKSVQPGADTLKIKRKMVTNGRRHELEDKNTQNRRSARSTANPSGKKKRSWMELTEESTTTVNYKSNLAQIRHNKVKQHNGEEFAKESDMSIAFKTPDEQYRITQKNDIEHDTRFLEYDTKERRVAPMGNKFVRNKIEQDGEMGDIAALS